MAVKRVAILLLAVASLAAAERRPSLTPGVVRPLTRAQVCSTRWGLDHRHVTLAMKQHVAAAYGVPWRAHGRYEFDHLVPRELGGADDERNLWPQPWPEARRKDRLENRLHRLVCAGTVSLGTAQRIFERDWTVGYDRYIKGTR